MEWLRRLTSSKSNLALLAWIASGAVVAVVLLASAFFHFAPSTSYNAPFYTSCTEIFIDDSTSVVRITCININEDECMGCRKEEVYLNMPSTLHYDEPIEIKFTLTPRLFSQDKILQEFSSLSGGVRHRSVRTTSYITATLSAPKSLIEIIARDDRIQKVTNGEPINFAWYVTPLKIGNIPVRLDLSAQYSAAKDAPVSTMQILQENWVVDARGINWVKYKIVELQPIGVALCGVGATIAAMLGFFANKFRKMRPEHKDD